MAPGGHIVGDRSLEVDVQQVAAFRTGKFERLAIVSAYHKGTIDLAMLDHERNRLRLLWTILPKTIFTLRLRSLHPRLL